MKRLLLALLLLLTPGCALLHNPRFWRVTVGSVLRAAYDHGGAELVGQRIDRLKAKGTISQVTGDKLKSAAQKGYDKLQAALDDEAADTLLVDDELLGPPLEE